ncbi:Protein-export membrane protein SecF [Candidatus Arsenophonus lipoptenae]|uniref:Protein-export membrane protein SecF n=2 Tax=Morganellaceae TaxID=1903414 RepID=A0A0X9VYR2_9GAMM|nr:Protein-export membrane protein SecF [Candidatus Arsenophonus lipoptenae]
MQKYNIEQLNHGRKVIDFMYWDYLAFYISIILSIISITIILTQGFNWGLDFTGGNIIEITLSKPIELDKIRNYLNQNGYKDPLIQNFGNSRNIVIRLRFSKENINKDISENIITIIKKKIDNQATLQRIEFIGPNISNELTQTGIIAILSSLISVLIYVSIRFEWRLAIGAVISLIHDLIITLGAISLFKIEVDMTILASLMSVIGYSLNDSIVVSDRIRENFLTIQIGTTYEILNVSLTQTLSRTLITSGTSLLVILMLYFLGGLVMKGFSLVMIIGITIGTFSSIYISSTLALKMGIKRKHLL